MRTRYTTNNGIAALSEPSFAADWNSPEDRIYDRPRLSPVEQIVVAVALAVLLVRMWWRW